MKLIIFLVFICNIFFGVIFVKNATCQQTNDEIICSQDPSNVIVANPYDCHSFYVCQHGNALKIVCPNNSIFNQKVGNCDLDYLECIEEEEDVTMNVLNDKKELLSEDEGDLVGEVSSENISTIGSETTEIFNSTSSFSSTTTNFELTPTDVTASTAVISTTEDPLSCETCSEPIQPHNVQCPLNDTQNPSFLPSDLFCDSFYLCYHGRPFEMFCSSGFYWNQDRKECILERESNCTDSSVGKKVPKCPVNGQHFFPHSERCNCFYYCENGIRSVQQCTAFKQWDIIEQTCKLDISARCIKTIPRSQRAKYYTL